MAQRTLQYILARQTRSAVLIADAARAPRFANVLSAAVATTLLAII